MGHQNVDERDIATLKREGYGHLPVPILCVHVGAPFQQPFRHFGMPDWRRARVVERGETRDVRGVGWRARVDEVANDVEVSHGCAVG